MYLNSSTLEIKHIQSNSNAQELLKKSHKLFPAGITYYNKFHVATQDLLLMIIADTNSPLLDTTRLVIKIN